jgi:ComF family protein
MRYFTLIQKLFDFCLPQHCVLCCAKTSRKIALCEACENDLPFLKTYCQRCGVPLPNSITLCGACLQNPPPFDRVVPLFLYESPVSQMLANLKFHEQLVIAPIFGALLAKRLMNEHLPDCIIPVPLHEKRLRERGFNQALEIAKPLSRLLNIPLDISHCHRTRHTDAQSSLPVEERKKNMQNAFEVDISFQAKHVVIIDDIMTTGHTIAALSKALRGAGVLEIDVWCCARTGLNVS